MSEPPLSQTRFSHISAVPFRRAPGHFEFCLVTSTAGRWLFPKGRIEAGESPVETALKEAYEEAGLQGSIVEESLGSYADFKIGGHDHVAAVLMEVTACKKRWPESHFRKRRWVTAEEAFRLLKNPGMRRLVTKGLVRLEAE